MTWGMLRRLTVALVLSAILHGALLVALSGRAAHPRSASGVLHARLIDDAPSGAVPTPLPLPPNESSESKVTRSPPRALPQRKTVTRAPGREPGAPEARNARAAALAVPRDPTWYSARELDELPRPLRPIRPQMRGRSEVGAQGRVVLRLAIDESGTVTDASIVNADAQADLASWALAAGREARFRPGTKGGRIVKSRVLLELTFGPRSDRGAL